MTTIGDSDINPPTIRRGAPLDASVRTAWPNRRTPNKVAVIGIECPENTALLAKADDITQQIGAGSPQIEILAGGHRTIGVCSRREVTRYGPSIKTFSLFAHLICPVFKSNAKAVSKKSSAAVQFAEGVAFWQASTVAGAV